MSSFEPSSESGVTSRTPDKKPNGGKRAVAGRFPGARQEAATVPATPASTVRSAEEKAAANARAREVEEAQWELEFNQESRSPVRRPLGSPSQVPMPTQRVEVLPSSSEGPAPRKVVPRNLNPQFEAAAQSPLKLGPPPRPPVVVSQPPEAPPLPLPPKAPITEETEVRKLAVYINGVLVRALAPVMDLLGAVGWKLGDGDVRHSLVYMPFGPKDERADPSDYLRIIDEGDPKLVSFDYFISRYGHRLGHTFLREMMAPWMKEKREKTKQLLAKEPEPKKQQAKQKMDAPLEFVDSCFDFQDEINNPRAFGTVFTEEHHEANTPLQKLENLYATLTEGGFNADGSERAKVDITTTEGKKQAEQIAQQIVNERIRERAINLLGLSKPEMQFAPAWAFELVSSDVFRAFVAPARLAAVELAHAQVIRIPGCETFTIKELICSKGVMDQFAWMIAYQYMDASKGLPMHRPKGETGERGIYVNINHMRETVQKRAYLCRIWFESVRAFPNPIIEQFKTYRNAQETQQEAWGRFKNPLNRIEFDAAMNRLEGMLPKRELKYTGL